MNHIPLMYYNPGAYVPLFLCKQLTKLQRKIIIENYSMSSL